jgi:LmbE family N-acetylglucosaminyl deacetylase
MKRILIGIILILLVSMPAFARVPEGDLLSPAQPGPDGKIDVLCVFAHQDDESIYGGGSLLKILKDPRVRLYILCMTFDQTSDAKDNLGITPDHIGMIRKEELETAAAVYGAEEVIQLMYHSRTLKDHDLEELTREIRKVIEQVGAEIVITHDPHGITGHQDHIACCKAATEAFQRSSAKVLYYPTLPKFIYWLVLKYRPAGEQDRPAIPTFKVDIRKEKRLKKMACYAHASQMHFTEVGTLTDMILILDHEYFTLAAKNK